LLDIRTLGSRIKELRKERGLTQDAFAGAIHVSFQAVSNWERGIAPPEIENLINIAAFFGVLVDDLLRSSDERLFLGVDGGGTKTEFAITSADGTVLDRFVTGGSNPNDIGFENAFNIICNGIRDALVKYPNIAYAFCGISGVSVSDHAKRMTELLSERYPSIKIKVITDSANLFGIDDSDMIVIAGTGSVVFVKDGDKYTRLGGWGYLFDTAGSSYDIGRAAVETALMEEDMNKEASAVASLLRKELETEHIFDAINRLYVGGKPYIASLAHVVFDAAEMGDPVAEKIINDSAKWIAELLNTGVRLYNVKKKATAGGGLFEHYGDTFVEHIRKYTDVEINVSKLPPVYGACRQSILLSGKTVSADYEKNFMSTYGGQQ